MFPARPKRKYIAHFLLLPELAESPPNDALVQACTELGFGVDLFAPGVNPETGAYGDAVHGGQAEYGYRWLAANAWRPHWRRYAAFSGTSEDPLAIVGVLSVLHRRPAIALADEIKSGTYSGDARPSWKSLCRFGMRRARLNIVNDESRIALQRDYAKLDGRQRVVVYPGGYRSPPLPVDTVAQRQRWGVSQGKVAIGISGGFNLSAGASWLLSAVRDLHDVHAVIQPLGLDPLARDLLGRVEPRERIYIENRRLGWREAWSQAAALDIGVAVYLNPAPQFQNMGTSSNRLCMFLAMGVPVIASRQPSFGFLERYDCGVLVDDEPQFREAVRRIQSRLPEMKANARRCWNEYVNTEGRYQALKSALHDVLKR